MLNFAFKQVAFLKSCGIKKGYPTVKNDQGHPLIEIAVAGRSNVGKSSLLNYIFGVKNMVKTSQRPGKTQLLNFFQIDKDCIFCDLPGYGFAKVSKKMRDEWALMIESYVENRDTLKLILLLLDVRHDPTEQDRQFFDWVKHHNHPVVIVLTKTDKLSKGKLMGQARKVMSKITNEKVPYILSSTSDKRGKKELIIEMKKVLDEVLDEGHDDGLDE